MADEKKREEVAVVVPSRGGEPEESKEPQMPPGKNPELQDGKKGTEMVS
jgi:hypothetical protein